MVKQPQLFAELLLKNQRKLFGLIYSLVQNLQDAEDIYQETAAVLWQKFDDFTPGTNFSAWSMRVAHLQSLQYIEANRRRRAFLNDSLLQSIAEAYQRDAQQADNPMADALAQCLQKLSVRDRRLAMKCYAPGRNFSEIASEENRTLGAVYQAINRVRKSLLTCVKRTMAMESR